MSEINPGGRVSLTCDSDGGSNSLVGLQFSEEDALTLNKGQVIAFEGSIVNIFTCLGFDVDINNAVVFVE